MKKDIKYYIEEIKKRDMIIEELKEKNKLLFKSSLRTSQRLEEIKEKLRDYTKKLD